MKARKRLILGVWGAILLGGLGLVAGLVNIMDNRSGVAGRALFLGGAALLTALLLFAAVGFAAIVIALLRGRMVRPLHNTMLLTLHFLFPLAAWVSPLFHCRRQQLECSFVELNNSLVHLLAPRAAPGKLLLLAPHCLQQSDCPYKITRDAGNCRRCGRCRVKDLLEIGEEYGIRVAVASGGTLARSFVLRYQPEAIVAIACERDLTSGIQDAAPLPVLGVFNQRPCGPCLDTQVDLGQVRAAIEYLLGGEK